MGATTTAVLVIPHRYVGADQVPVVVTQVSYVSDGWIPVNWYLFNGLTGLLIGGLAAATFRSHPHAERPIRQISSAAGA